MLKAAFFDVDGTLLTSSSGEIPGSAVDALARMRERGVKLFLATGRHKLELTDMLQRYPLHFDGFLTLNSGYCYFADGAVFYKNPLHPGDVAAAVDYLKGPGRSLAVMFREEEARYYSCVSEYVQRIDPENFRQVRVGDIGRAVSHDVFQMCPYGTDEEVAGLLSVMPHSKATRWNSYGMDVVPQSGGKSAGLARALELLGISRQEAAAFGDGENDEEMLLFVGTGIAMGNAPGRVKAAADYVTDHIDSGGIAQAVRMLGF